MHGSARNIKISRIRELEELVLIALGGDDKFRVFRVFRG